MVEKIVFVLILIIAVGGGAIMDICKVLILKIGVSAPKAEHLMAIVYGDARSA